MTRRPDEPRFARLRSGDMAQCNEPEPRRLGLGWLAAWAVAFGLAGLIGAAAFGEVPPHYEPPRGYEPCTMKGC